MSSISLWGLGGCGTKLVCTAMDIINKIEDKYNSYSVAFTNSNQLELYKDYVTTTNSLTAPGGGSGGNIAKAKYQLECVNNDFNTFIIDNILNKDAIILFSSADGGWGRGTLLETLKTIKLYDPSMPVNLCIAMPNLKTVDKDGLNNTLGLLKEIEEILKKQKINGEDILLNSVMFIDNNKMVIGNEDHFNHKAMELLIRSLEFRGESIDSEDAFVTNCYPGYKVILDLKEENRYTYAIEKSVLNSPFIFPDEFYYKSGQDKLSIPEPINFTRVLASLSYDEKKGRTVFPVEDLSLFINSSNRTKVDINSTGENLIVASGYFSTDALLPKKLVYELLTKLEKLKQRVKYNPDKDKAIQINTESSVIFSNKKMSRADMIKRRKNKVNMDGKKIFDFLNK